ncbi:sodium:alanine symporter family protein [Fusobacterium sp. IOR10]|uniref:alanine/glycine:cation symporter family protein n=1 Tax=Fusobacterium sp. IOR10 TaxID=2665157 RepID=UPI0013D5F0BE|nr:alanine/glycine:cation symporter family protein [Fusobacterium sp. IOR10]
MIENIVARVFISVIDALNKFLWGDVIVFNLGGVKIGLSIIVLLLLPSGIYFTIKTKFLPFRLFPQMLKAVVEPKKTNDSKSISGFQALIVATATRVGMGNLAGVAAAITFGGAGAVFWMWIVALLGSATAFIESTLAQIYKEKDPLYGGYRGGPAYYIKRMSLVTKIEEEDINKIQLKDSNKLKGSCGKVFRKASEFKLMAGLFAISALICWGGISQIVANSVSQSFNNAFGISPLYTTILLVVLSSIVIFKKQAVVMILDRIVPVMAGLYLLITIFILFKNITVIPNMFREIISQALGFKQVVAGGFGAVLMNGVKRGLFSNEAGSGSAPCAAAAADIDHPAKQGLIQSLGVFIDTLFICSCSAFIILLVPSDKMKGLMGMDLLQEAMRYHIGEIGVIFIAIILFLFSFSTFLGLTFYARGNVAFLFGDSWKAQNIYRIFMIAMLFFGGIAQYTWVWNLGDLGVALMTVFNILAILPLSGQAIDSLKDYELKFLKKN